MNRTLIAAAVALSVLGAGAAVASDRDRCDAPMSQWQPRDALRQKLEAEGWKVTRIKTDDGCYEAYATDDKGRRIEAHFNPQTLELIKAKAED